MLSYLLPCKCFCSIMQWYASHTTLSSCFDNNPSTVVFIKSPKKPDSYRINSLLHVFIERFICRCDQLLCAVGGGSFIYMIHLLDQ